MALVLQQNGYVGWYGPTGSSVFLQARVAGDSELVAVRYAGKNITDYTSIDDHTWGIKLQIAPGKQRLFFTFFSPGPDDIDIVEVVDPPAAGNEQEISGATHAVSPTLAPQIEGR